MVKCEICGKSMKQITNTHLKIHNLTSDEYKFKFPNSFDVKKRMLNDNPMHVSGEGMYIEQLRYFFANLDNPRLDNNIFEASELFKKMILARDGKN